MRHLVTLGVDGLITNRPDLLREVLASMDQPLPRPHPARG
jgi:glycerophosphoryl diester phosphodiesterase